MNLPTSSTYRPNTNRLSGGAGGSWCVSHASFAGKRLFRGGYSELGVAQEINTDLDRGDLPVAGTHRTRQAGGIAR
ncbi:hypothetical protein PN499_23025 [Kamptonema animale CS-326]|uniref:hypothetical protein n=1 Tax=Kamptonema animale TaxID=92934 RepID=UPI002331281F|nr:hypothetical protein [Kamptonema animale]MDB9514077.1 hypothetical protein [Kamptonema animale CS-326]